MIILGRNRSEFESKQGQPWPFLDPASRAWKLLKLLLAEVKPMKKHLRVAFLASALMPWSITTAVAQSSSDEFYRQWVDYRDGEISVAFDQTPVHFALQALQAKTGFQIVIPSTSETKVVNLRLDRQQLEPAVRSLISTIGFKNFALMYDGSGRPHRAVVLSAQSVAVDESVAVVKNEPAAQPLTVEERDRLQKTLERWTELKQDERSRIEGRLKNLPDSEEREQLVKEYGRQILGLAK